MFYISVSLVVILYLLLLSAELRNDHQEISAKINENVQLLHSARLSTVSSSVKDSGLWLVLVIFSSEKSSDEIVLLCWISLYGSLMLQFAYETVSYLLWLKDVNFSLTINCDWLRWFVVITSFLEFSAVVDEHCFIFMNTCLGECCFASC